MINPNKMTNALHDVLYGVNFQKTHLKDGYWKWTVHIKIDNEKDEVTLKQVNFFRYLGLPGTPENKFGDPFEIAAKQKRQSKLRECIELLGMITPIVLSVGILVLLVMGAFFNG